MTANIIYAQCVAQPQNPRDRMVSSAMHLFRQHGVAATALSDVVEHSGAPRGSLYHYFPDGKAQLAEEATALGGRLMGKTISKWMAAKGPAGTVEALIDLYRDQLRASDFTIGCPVVAGALEGGESPGARAIAGEAFTSWESTLAGALWQHGIPAQRADTLAAMIVCSIEGAIIVAKAQRSTRPLDRVGEELDALLRSAL
jgi:AcrR family transcriptional regulator